MPNVHEDRIFRDANSMPLPKANDNGTESITNLNDGNGKIDHETKAHPIPAAEFFVTAPGAMLLLARTPASDAVTEHSLGLSSIVYTFGWLPIASSEPPVAGKPFFQSEHIIKVLADLPRVLLRGEQGFREVGLDFLFGNELIWKAALVRKSSR